jgi:hypothetical protein
VVIKSVAFDFGHTLIDERKDGDVPHESRPVHLMPEVSEVLPFLPLPLAVWANTRTASEAELRQWLDRAGIGQFCTWVVFVIPMLVVNSRVERKPSSIEGVNKWSYDDELPEVVRN